MRKWFLKDSHVFVCREESIPFTNAVLETFGFVDNDITNVDSLLSTVGSTSEYCKLEEILNGVKNRFNRIGWIVNCVLDFVFAVL